MKRITIAVSTAVLVAVSTAMSITVALAKDTLVNGYIKRDGTYVAPHFKTTPNDTRLDNYSTRGNINPYTGQPGHVNPIPTYNVPHYPLYQQPTLPKNRK